MNHLNGKTVVAVDSTSGVYVVEFLKDGNITAVELNCSPSGLALATNNAKFLIIDSGEDDCTIMDKITGEIAQFGVSQL
jgi:hypothetical protein